MKKELVIIDPSEYDAHIDYILEYLSNTDVTAVEAIGILELCKETIIQGTYED